MSAAYGRAIKRQLLRIVHWIKKKKTQREKERNRKRRKTSNSYLEKIRTVDVFRVIQRFVDADYLNGEMIFRFNLKAGKADVSFWK